MASPLDVDPGHRAAADQAGAGTAGRPGVPQRRPTRGCSARRRRPGGGEQPVGLDQRRQRLGLGDLDHPAGDAQLVLQRDVPLERRDVLRVRRGGTGSRPGAGRSPGRTSPRNVSKARRLRAPELDVDRVGELGAHAAGGLAGRTRAELALLDQDDVGDPRPGQVVGRAEPDDPAADDHDGGAGGKPCLWHPRPHFRAVSRSRVRCPDRSCLTLTRRRASRLHPGRRLPAPASLEATLGVALVQRSGRHLILTDAGRVMADHREELLQR